MPLRKNNVRVVSATEVISSGADGILPEAVLEGFAEYDSANPVDTFVNAIFLYDDKMVLAYNFHESTETITFGELQGIFPNGFRNLDRDLASEPEKTLGRERAGVFLLPKSMVFGLLCRKGEQNTLKGKKDDKLS